jgi:hypothetical protein
MGIVIPTLGDEGFRDFLSDTFGDVWGVEFYCIQHSSPPPILINETFTRCYYTVLGESEPTRAAAATPRGGQHRAIKHGKALPLAIAS